MYGSVETCERLRSRHSARRAARVRPSDAGRKEHDRNVATIGALRFSVGPDHKIRFTANGKIPTHPLHDDTALLPVDVTAVHLAFALVMYDECAVSVSRRTH